MLLKFGYNVLWLLDLYCIFLLIRGVGMLVFVWYFGWVGWCVVIYLRKMVWFVLVLLILLMVNLFVVLLIDRRVVDLLGGLIGWYI